MGNGGLSSRSLPAAIAPGEIPATVTVTELAAGVDHVIALGNDGNVYGWGNNVSGQLGVSAKSPVSTPVKAVRGAIPANVKIVHIAAGNRFSLAVGDDGKVYSWGDGTSGRLGVTTSASSTPVLAFAPMGSKATRVVAGDAFALALLADGSLYSWGAGSDGQLGGGTKPASRATAGRVDTPESVTFTEVAAGANFVVARGADGRAYSWGGLAVPGVPAPTTATPGPTPSPSGTPTPPFREALPAAVKGGALPDGQTVIGVGAGAGSAYLVGAGGALYAWGANAQGQLGDGTTTTATQVVAVKNAPAAVIASNLTAYVGASMKPVALQPSGVFDTVTFSISPSLPAGLTLDPQTGVLSGTPQQQGSARTFTVTATGSTFGNASASFTVTVASGGSSGLVAAGGGFSVALDGSGNAIAWGNNDKGQLGDGTTTASSTPVVVARGEIPDGVDLKQVSAGGSTAVALGSDGQLYAWGDNSSGQLGNGTTTSSSTPVRVLAGDIPPGTVILQVAVGAGAAAVLGDDGNIYAWAPTSAPSWRTARGMAPRRRRPWSHGAIDRRTRSSSRSPPDSITSSRSTPITTPTAGERMATVRSVPRSRPGVARPTRSSRR